MRNDGTTQWTAPRDRLAWHPAKRLRLPDGPTADEDPVGPVPQEPTDTELSAARIGFLAQRLEDELEALESERGSLKGLLEQSRETLARVQTTAREPDGRGRAQADLFRLVARLEEEVRTLDNERGSLDTLLGQARKTLEGPSGSPATGPAAERLGAPVMAAAERLTARPPSVAQERLAPLVVPVLEPPAAAGRETPRQPVQPRPRRQEVPAPVSNGLFGSASVSVAPSAGRARGILSGASMASPPAAPLSPSNETPPRRSRPIAGLLLVAVAVVALSSAGLRLGYDFLSRPTPPVAAVDATHPRMGGPGDAPTGAVEAVPAAVQKEPAGAAAAPVAHQPGAAAPTSDSAASAAVAPNPTLAAAPTEQTQATQSTIQARPTTVAAEPTSATASTAVSATTAPQVAIAPGVPMVLRLPTYEPPTLDPGVASDSVSIQIVAHIFEGLVGQDADGAIQPRVAERWEVSADGLTYTFHLREGARWTDGKPVTAADFEWAWKRNVDPRMSSSYASAFAPIKNAEQIVSGALPADQLGVSAVDDHTLVVVLERPAVYFLSLAAIWPLMPLRQDVVEQHADGWTEAGSIVSNGPFRLAAWDHDQRIVMERNDDYWGPKPTLQRVELQVYSDPAAALADYQSGALDSFGTSMSIPSGSEQQLIEDPKAGYKTYEESGTFFLVLNHRQSYLQDARVRRALGMTIDRDRLIFDALQARHWSAYSLQPPGIVGSDPDLWPHEDVAGARQLLAQAGFPDGKGFPKLRYGYSPTGQHALLAQYLQKRWKDTLGIDLDLKAMSWDSFLAWPHTADWAANGDVYPGGGWSSDYNDPNDWYNLLWDSGADARQFNAGWSDPDYDQLVRQAAAESDPNTRQALYHQAEQILAREYPNIPVYYYGGQTLVRPYVKGLQPSRLLGILPLETITVDPH